MLRYYLVSGIVGLCFTAVIIIAASAAIRQSPTVQPIAFNHKKHFEYFRGGEHRQAKFKLHEEILGEIPEELVEGDCIECHGEFAEAIEDTPKIGTCAGCHEIFLKYDIRARRDVRPCIGCHRSAVSGYAASLPGVGVCVACHEEPLTDGREEQKLGKYIEAHQEIPWLRVYDYLPGDVFFSHERHVMLGEMDCRQCHGEVEDFTTPLVRLVDLEMGDCIGCHGSANADTDCMACHR